MTFGQGFLAGEHLEQKSEKEEEEAAEEGSDEIEEVESPHGELDEDDLGEDQPKKAMKAKSRRQRQRQWLRDEIRL